MQTAEGYYYTDTLGEMSKDPVVLIHGIGGSHSSWPAAMRKLQGRRTIVLDLPGHGHSECSACQTVAAYARSVESVLRAAHIYRAVLVGYSLGGQIALQFGINHPNQVAGLGLIACSSEPAIPTKLFELLNDPSAAQAVRSMVSSLMFVLETSSLKIEEMEKVLFSARKGTISADWRAFHEYRFPDLEHDLREVPLWLCNATDDRLISGRTLRELKRRRPSSICTFIDRCGHGILAEQPLLLARALEMAFLQVENSPA